MLCTSPTGTFKKFSLPTNMKPRDFCREWFSRPGDSEEDKDEREEQWGYKEKCTRALSDVTGIGAEGVSRWGKKKGIDFPDMPEQHEKTLAYAIALKRIAEAALRGNPHITQVVIEQLKNDQ